MQEGGPTVAWDHTYGMILCNMESRKSARKQRRTFTLSPESLVYLEQEAGRRGAESQSSVLDEILCEKAHEQIVKDYEAQVTAYYDSLTDKEVEEDRAWGEFAGSHLVLTDEEFVHAQSAARRDLVHETADRSTGKRKASSNHRVRESKKRSSAG